MKNTIKNNPIKIYLIQFSLHTCLVYTQQNFYLFYWLGSKVNEIKDIVHSYFSILSYGKGEKTDVCKRNLTYLRQYQHWKYLMSVCMWYASYLSRNNYLIIPDLANR